MFETILRIHVYEKLSKSKIYLFIILDLNPHVGLGYGDMDTEILLEIVFRISIGSRIFY